MAGISAVAWLADASRGLAPGSGASFERWYWGLQWMGLVDVKMREIRLSLPGAQCRIGSPVMIRRPARINSRGVARLCSRTLNRWLALLRGLFDQPSF